LSEGWLSHFQAALALLAALCPGARVMSLDARVVKRERALRVACAHGQEMDFRLRKANPDDRPAIASLIELSARALSLEDYTEAQIEGAIRSVFGVDSDLISDATYFVAEASGLLVGCGGWSKRRTLFGGDQFAHRAAGWLDPLREAARIRAFFVHPEWARKGIARAILESCEAEARASGFQALELMATLPGLKLYRALGYTESERVTYDLGGGLSIDFVPMTKRLR
jgi:GNAT superfamily N-acetyltransferase